MKALELFPESGGELAMLEKPEWFYRQSGVIAFQVAARGPEVLLVTTRRRKHWVIPKGIVEPSLTPAASAVQEAWEEAGAHGQLHPEPVGNFSYHKWGGTCRVEVFLFAVEELVEPWPEANLRRRCWFAWEDAADCVRAAGLRRLLLRLPESLAGLNEDYVKRP